jgi:hypothetical protein
VRLGVPKSRRYISEVLLEMVTVRLGVPKSRRYISEVLLEMELWSPYPRSLNAYY